ncbi:MAG: type II toxin-antitoxin system prevent-host-death family antitoxin [Actinomycetota bacterium]
MDQVTIRELRNKGGEVIDRVVHGETLIVTRAGIPVAELRPMGRSRLTAAAFLDRWNRLPAIDPRRLREEIDSLIDPHL